MAIYAIQKYYGISIRYFFDVQIGLVSYDAFAEALMTLDSPVTLT
jgi:hypothetical protein